MYVSLGTPDACRKSPVTWKDFPLGEFRQKHADSPGPALYDSYVIRGVWLSFIRLLHTSNVDYYYYFFLLSWHMKIHTDLDIPISRQPLNHVRHHRHQSDSQGYEEACFFIESDWSRWPEQRGLQIGDNVCVFFCVVVFCRKNSSFLLFFFGK